MSETVDARGLSCPQPVLLTLDQIKKQKGGTIEVLVDTETSKENVSRAAQGQGWEVNEVTETDDSIKLIIQKG